MASTEDDGWTGGEYAGTPDEQNEKARQDWEGAGRPGDRYRWPTNSIIRSWRNRNCSS